MTQAMHGLTIGLTVAGLMVLPGLAGHWLDRRLGTGWLVLVGFALGFVSGIYYLLAAVAELSRKKSNGRPGDPPST